MKKTMGLAARKELLKSVKEDYNLASWLEKGKVLDSFVAVYQTSTGLAGSRQPNWPVRWVS